MTRPRPARRVWVVEYSDLASQWVFHSAFGTKREATAQQRHNNKACGQQLFRVRPYTPNDAPEAK